MLILCVLLGLAAMSQQRPRLRPQQPERQEWLPKWKELNLSAEQKRRIIDLIQRQRIQKMLDQKALDDILTAEQKKKLQYWKKEKNQKDTTY